MLSSLLKQLVVKVPVALRWPLLLIGVVALGLLLWLYGVNVKNRISNWWYNKGTEASHSEIQSAKNEAAAAIKIAEEAIAAFEAEKKLTAEERAKRIIAETALADKTKNTDQKLKAYEAAIAKRPTVTGPESTDELCARAAALGIDCQ